MINAIYAIGLIAVGTAAYLYGKKKEQDKSKNFTIKEDVIKQEADKEVETQTSIGDHMEDGYGMTGLNTAEQAPIETNLFPITESIRVEQRGAGQYNKLIGQMRFEGFQTLAFAVSGYNSTFDILTPIQSNPDQKFAVILDEVQSNPSAVEQVQMKLKDVNPDNVRLYTVEYQG
jgi:hypothetical protein